MLEIDEEPCKLACCDPGGALLIEGQENQEVQNFSDQEVANQETSSASNSSPVELEQEDDRVVAPIEEEEADSDSEEPPQKRQRLTTVDEQPYNAALAPPQAISNEDSFETSSGCSGSPEEQEQQDDSDAEELQEERAPPTAQLQPYYFPAPPQGNFGNPFGQFPVPMYYPPPPMMQNYPAPLDQNQMYCDNNYYINHNFQPAPLPHQNGVQCICGNFCCPFLDLPPPQACQDDQTASTSTSADSSSTTIPSLDRHDPSFYEEERVLTSPTDVRKKQMESIARKILHGFVGAIRKQRNIQPNPKEDRRKERAFAEVFPGIYYTTGRCFFGLTDLDLPDDIGMTIFDSRPPKCPDCGSRLCDFWLINSEGCQFENPQEFVTVPLMEPGFPKMIPKWKSWLRPHRELFVNEIRDELLRGSDILEGREHPTPLKRGKEAWLLEHECFFNSKDYVEYIYYVAVEYVSARKYAKEMKERLFIYHNERKENWIEYMANIKFPYWVIKESVTWEGYKCIRRLTATLQIEIIYHISMNEREYCEMEREYSNLRKTIKENEFFEAPWDSRLSRELLSCLKKLFMETRERPRNKSEADAQLLWANRELRAIDNSNNHWEYIIRAAKRLHELQEKKKRDLQKFEAVLEKEKARLNEILEARFGKSLPPDLQGKKDVLIGNVRTQTLFLMDREVNSLRRQCTTAEEIPGVVDEILEKWTPDYFAKSMKIMATELEKARQFTLQKNNT